MKYLIVYCGHDDSTSANGVCVWNIAKELKRRGHDVWAIWQYKDVAQKEFEKNGVHCYAIGESWYYKFTQWHKKHKGILFDILYKGVSFLRLFYAMPLYPNISPYVAYKSHTIADRLVRMNNIDKVLGIYLPYHAIDATLYLKRKYKDRLFVANYHLDLISSPINTNKIVKAYKNWKGNMAIKRELSLIDLMLLPMSAKNIFNDKKIRYVDFPLFVKDSEYAESEFVYPHNCINITYIGSLDKNNRNPIYLLSLLNDSNKKLGGKIRLHIWGNLADQETQDVLKKYDFVEYHGLIENQYVTYLLNQSDCLLNVSNAVTYNMIPSKIFQLFSMHKPIINIVRHEKDSSLNYFFKYPNVLIVNEYAPQQSDAQKLFDFLSKGKSEPFCYNDDAFVESTPGYICNYLD